MDDKNRPASAPTSTEGRRPYRTPRLARLGTLTEITASVGSTGMNDGGHGKIKTR